MAEKAYFISDLHLGSVKEPNSFVLIKFLKSLHAQPGKIYLFLLGDIFDLWVGEHKYFITKFSAIIEELNRLQANGVEIHYFEGNHDLYLENYFTNQLGMRVHTGPTHFTILNKKLRVEHGDQMDPADRGYIFLRWFLRTSFMKWLAPRLPEWFVVRLGESMSKASRQYTSQIKSISQDKAKKVIHEHAYRAHRKEKFDILVAGHVHVAEDAMLGFDKMKYRVINLGSWFDHPRVFIVSEEFTGFQRLET